MDRIKEDKSIVEMWISTLVHNTVYTFDAISETVKKLADLLLTTSKAPASSKLMAVRKK